MIELTRSKSLTLAGALLAAGQLFGCGPVAPHLPETCGIALVPASDVTDGGLDFPDVTLGQSMLLQVPVKDTADTDETLLGATVSGTDAIEFTVESTFPISVPAGTSVMLEISFAPTHPGTSSADLDLQTEAMGTSTVEIGGTGVSPDGG